MDSRKVEITLIYEDTDVSADVAGYLLDFSFGDNGQGQADDLQIKLEDRFQLWSGDWKGKKGNTINATIKTHNWEKENESEMLHCGQFEVDTIECSGPPDIVSIKAVSIPLQSGARNEKNTKAWENVTLKQIARDIASKAGLTLQYHVDADPKFDRIDQTKQSDLAFLQETARKEGISVKVTDKKLVLYDDALLEKSLPVMTIIRGTSRVLSYSFSDKSTDCSYSACTVSYYDSKQKKNITYTYKPKGGPENGPILKVNERVQSLAEAEKMAKKSLREKNKDATTARLSLVGSVKLVQGCTINLKGWGQFDGIYFIESAQHSVSNGYTVDLTLRKVLTYL